VSLFRVLPPTTLARPLTRSSCNSHHFSGLEPLELSCLAFSDRHRLFSIACGLFLQNTGGGGISHPSRVTANHRFSSHLLSATYESPFFQPLCFHIHLRCPGVAGYRRKFLEQRPSSATRSEEQTRIHVIIKSADGPGDRWLRAIGAGGKSGHRRRRLARAGDEVRATRLVTPGDGHAGSAAKWSFSPS